MDVSDEKKTSKPDTDVKEEIVEPEGAMIPGPKAPPGAPQKKERKFRPLPSGITEEYLRQTTEDVVRAKHKERSALSRTISFPAFEHITGKKLLPQSKKHRHKIISAPAIITSKRDPVLVKN